MARRYNLAPAKGLRKPTKPSELMNIARANNFLKMRFRGAIGALRDIAQRCGVSAAVSAELDFLDKELVEAINNNYQSEREAAVRRQIAEGQPVPKPRKPTTTVRSR
jgi:hypothetical protein